MADAFANDLHSKLTFSNRDAKPKQNSDDLGLSALGLPSNAAAPSASGAGHDQIVGKGKSTFTLIFRGGGFRGGGFRGGGFRGGAIGYRGGFGRSYAFAGRGYGIRRLLGRRTLLGRCWLARCGWGVRRAYWGGGWRRPYGWGWRRAGWYGGWGRPGYGWGWRRAAWYGGWRRPWYGGWGWRRAGWYGGWGWPVGVGLVGWGMAAEAATGIAAPLAMDPATAA